MYSKFGFIFIFTISTFCFSTFLDAQTHSSDDRTGIRVIMLDLKDAEISPIHLNDRLSKQFKIFADNIIPPDKRSKRVRFDISMLNDNEVPGAYIDRKSGEFVIKLPSDYHSWTSNKNAIRSFMGWLFCANLGITPEYELSLRNHFLTVGASAKALAFAEFGRIPLARYMPIAHTLASYGIFPAVIDIANDSRTTPDSTLFTSFEDEYAELLLDACISSKFAKNGITRKLIISALADENRDIYGSLAESVIEYLKKTPHDPSSFITIEEENEINKWFRAFASTSLQTFFTPLSSEYFEYLYNKNSSYSFKDSEGRNYNINLAELPSYASLMPSGAGDAITELTGRLNLLSISAPPLIREELSAIHLALSRCRTDNSPKAAAELVRSEKSLFAALERSVMIDDLLRKTEQRLIPPSTRFGETMRLLQQEKESERRFFKGASTMLDRHDIFYNQEKFDR